jgi:hypothetical protein
VAREAEPRVVVAAVLAAPVVYLDRLAWPARAELLASTASAAPLEWRVPEERT